MKIILIWHKGVFVLEAYEILFGVVGLLSGLMGSNQDIVTFLNWGMQWNAGRH
jgi:hypothetical protein